jgi:hypothetical protein
MYHIYDPHGEEKRELVFEPPSAPRFSSHHYVRSFSFEVLHSDPQKTFSAICVDAVDGFWRYTGHSPSVAGPLVLVVKENTSDMMMFALISSQLKSIRFYTTEANT